MHPAAGITAIDFRQLVREEKARARKERQQRLQEQQQQQQQQQQGEELIGEEPSNGSSSSSSNNTNQQQQQQQQNANRNVITEQTTVATTGDNEGDVVKVASTTATTRKSRTATTSTTSSATSDWLLLAPLDIPENWLTPVDEDHRRISFPIRLNRTLHCVSHQDPPFIFYIPNFLHPTSQQLLISWLTKLPHATEGDKDPNGKWTTLRYARRRVALMDGLLNQPNQLDQQQQDHKQQQDHEQQKYLPRPIQDLAQSLVDAGIFSDDQPPNHVLINEYFEPTQGIMPHTDGPLYAPTTATISIGGGDVLLNFTPRRRDVEDCSSFELASLSSSSSLLRRQVWLQGNGSLVVFTDDAYTSYLHGIDEHVQVETASSVCANAAPGTKIVRGYRMSLTFRHKTTLLPSAEEQQ